MADGKEREDDIASHSVSTRSHGSERGRAWELVDFWSTTYPTLLIYGTYQPAPINSTKNWKTLLVT